MNRARNFPPSAAFVDMTAKLAEQHADLETAANDDDVTAPLCDVWCETEKTLIYTPANNAGDILLKVAILANVAEGSVVPKEEWRALAADVERINGAGMMFLPEPWLRRWTNKGGGYVRTDTGLAFVAPEPPTVQQQWLLDELHRAQGRQAVADVIDKKAEPAPPSWEAERAAFDAKSAEIDLIEATDGDLDDYWAKWDAAMLCPSDDIEAANWKMAQFLHWTGVCGEFVDDAAEKYRAAIFADVARHARKGGVV